MAKRGVAGSGLILVGRYACLKIVFSNFSRGLLVSVLLFHWPVIMPAWGFGFFKLLEREYVGLESVAPSVVRKNGC